MLQHGNLRSKETKQKLNFSYLEPLEGLDADDIGADDLHGLDDLVLLELSDDLGALLVRLLGGLNRDELVTLLGDDGSHITT